ncbi:MAG: helix-turn-helix domain-containing protein [Gemmataceae bacterium]|nr:helix-turn-helix domain-containing protein [Gemmataceae bacterium]
MSDSALWADLLAGVRAGDPSAARRVHDLYVARLIGLARARLADRLAARVDPDDVVNSAFKSFFVRHAAGGFEVPDPGALWAVLATITARKCRARRQEADAAKRSVGRERPSDAEPADPAAPSPAEAAELADLVEHLMRGLAEPGRVVLRMRLQGYSPPEIAAAVGLTERSVFRWLDRVRDRLTAATAD